MKPKITDIALKYGYETPESFTKAFTRFHGIAPKVAREAFDCMGEDGDCISDTWAKFYQEFGPKWDTKPRLKPIMKSILKTEAKISSACYGSR